MLAMSLFYSQELEAQRTSVTLQGPRTRCWRGGKPGSGHSSTGPGHTVPGGARRLCWAILMSSPALPARGGGVATPTRR